MNFGNTSLTYTENFVQVLGPGQQELILKIEWLNRVNSIKLKTALSLIEDAESRNLLHKGKSEIIESSSGNLGVALASICAARGYRFTCVVDPNVNRQSLKAMLALGATVVRVDKRDQNNGYLGARIAYITDALKNNPHLLWLNQYANPANSEAHYRQTAREVAEHFPSLNYLFIGAGTTGTLMGCARYFAEHLPNVKIVAVDSTGSITFGKQPGPRYIPGIGTSRVPELLDMTASFEIEMVPEIEAVQACRWLARTHGLLAGGSTGSVLAAVWRRRNQIPPSALVVALSPDSGERYLDTVFDDEWVSQKFGNDVVASVADWPGKSVSPAA